MLFRSDPTVAELVQALGGELHGDASRPVRRIASLASAGPDALSFLAQSRLQSQLASTHAGVLVVRADLLEQALARGASVIVTPDPYLYYARLTRWFAQRLRPAPSPGVHPSAVIGQGVSLHPSASVGPQCVVDDGAVLEAGVVLGPQCHVGRAARLGEGTRLLGRVWWGEACVIGARGTVQPGAVIGGDGFGFAPSAGEIGRAHV